MPPTDDASVKLSSPRFARSTAAVLIRDLLADGVFSREQLASELVVSTSRVDGYATGRERVPADRQLYLALLAIDRPEYAHAGHKLKGQALATLAFEGHDTVVH